MAFDAAAHRCRRDRVARQSAGFGGPFAAPTGWKSGQAQTAWAARQRWQMAYSY